MTTQPLPTMTPHAHNAAHIALDQTAAILSYQRPAALATTARNIRRDLEPVPYSDEFPLSPASWTAAAQYLTARANDATNPAAQVLRVAASIAQDNARQSASDARRN